MRRVGGGANAFFFCAKAEGTGGATGGGTADLFAVEFLKEENIFFPELKSTSPNFFCCMSFDVDLSMCVSCSLCSDSSLASAILLGALRGGGRGEVEGTDEVCAGDALNLRAAAAAATRPIDGIAS